MLAILGELCWLQFFKTVYLETSNVRFGSFFQNPVTYIGVVLFLVFLALNNHCILISFVSLCHHFHFLSVKLHSDKIDSTVFTALNLGTTTPCMPVYAYAI